MYSTIFFVLAGIFIILTLYLAATADRYSRDITFVPAMGAVLFAVVGYMFLVLN